MIVPMKRLTLLCLQKDREAALEALAELSVVHVTPVKPPAGEELDDARNAVARAAKAVEVLTAAAKAASERAEKAKNKLRGEDMPAVAEEEAEPEDIDAVIGRVHELVKRRQDLESEAETLRYKLKRMAPFGDFDPARVAALRAAGISVFLAEADPEAKLAAPEGVVLQVLNRGSEAQYVAVFALGARTFADLDLGAPLTEVPLPERSLAEWRARLEEIKEESPRIEVELEGLVRARSAVRQRLTELEEKLDFLTVREGMGEEAVVTYLQGYVPADAEERLRAAAREHGWGLVLENPRCGEPVPTLLRYNRFIKPVLAVLQFLGIYPGYEESDVGWTFLIFFSLFCAMVIGDAGYGCLLLFLTILLSTKYKDKVAGYIRGMLGIVSVATIIWGTLCGNWLGLPDIPDPLARLSIPWLSSRNNVMWLCFLIGATHLSIAHVWNALTAPVRTKALAELGWVCIVWTMFFLAGNLVVGRAMPDLVLYVFGAGVVLVVLFMATPQELKTDWINHALLPLTVINSFVDVVSYIRLYAVGFAGLALMQSFYSMVVSGIGFGTLLMAVVSILILVFAHTLNLALVALGVLVHAVRLNTLEFSTHKGIGWQGFPYRPFACRRGLEREAAKTL